MDTIMDILPNDLSSTASTSTVNVYNSTAPIAKN
jgi:hypothetical protein